MKKILASFLLTKISLVEGFELKKKRRREIYLKYKKKITSNNK